MQLMQTQTGGLALAAAMLLLTAIRGNDVPPATTMDGTARTKRDIDTSGERPRPLPVHVEGIPPELRERGQWVGWRYDLREKDGKRKWTKLPVNLRTGALANSMDRSTWMAFDQALESYSRNGCDGIGFVFSGDDPYCLSRSPGR
jgi:hypothetical protein